MTAVDVLALLLLDCNVVVVTIFVLDGVGGIKTLLWLFSWRWWLCGVMWMGVDFVILGDDDEII